MATLKAGGFEEVQGGTAFHGEVPLGYIHNASAHWPWMEVFEFQDGFEMQPDDWDSAPPAS